MVLLRMAPDAMASVLPAGAARVALTASVETLARAQGALESAVLGAMASALPAGAARVALTASVETLARAQGVLATAMVVLVL